MEAIRDLIEWIAQDSGVAVAMVFPYLLIALVALYLASLVIGYLRVSQVGSEEETHGAERAVRLIEGGSGTGPAPRGVPFCLADGIEYPVGARFCTACEADLVLDCRQCGARLGAADDACFRCGTPTGVGDVPLLS
jgi:hypothetical protein